MDLVGSLQSRLRDWHLAGDGRTGGWARAEARRRQLRFLREAWPHFAVALVVSAALAFAVATRLPGGFLRGLVVGAAATTIFAALTTLTQEATGAAGMGMGVIAEEWSASELRPLRPRGWTLINGFVLGIGDIDHLLVGPAGVIVVETKWRGSGWRLDPPDVQLQEALDQVNDNAKQVQLWAPIKKAACHVRPVLFLWEPAGRNEPSADAKYRVIDGVTVIRGMRMARAWRASVDATTRDLSAEQAYALAERVRRHLAARDRHEAAKNAAPPSLAQLYWRFVGCLIALLGGVLVVFEPLASSQRWLAVPTTLIALGLGTLGRRYQSLRLVAITWMAAVSGSAVVVGVVLGLN